MVVQSVKRERHVSCVCQNVSHEVTCITPIHYCFMADLSFTYFFSLHTLSKKVTVKGRQKRFHSSFFVPNEFLCNHCPAINVTSYLEEVVGEICHQTSFLYPVTGEKESTFKHKESSEFVLMFSNWKPFTSLPQSQPFQNWVGFLACFNLSQSDRFQVENIVPRLVLRNAEYSFQSISSLWSHFFA